MTLVIAMSGFLLGLIFGALGALAKLSHSAVLRLVAETYTLIVRGIPELLVIYLLFFGASPFFMQVGRIIGFAEELSFDALAAGILSIGIVSGAYQTEIIRGALLAIPKGQFEAATAFSFRRWQGFRLIALPQLLRHALAPMGNEWLLTIKGTSLISVTGMVELMRATYVAANSTRMPFTFYIAGFMLYLVLTFVSEWIFRKFERRLNRGFVRGRLN